MNDLPNETNAPKVTVITGYYNRGDALTKTIDSIMNQSFTNFEFIIFNDKSTDDTEQRLIEIEAQYNDPRLIIINHTDNLGFVQGMINAVNMANGEYICVQGSGDISHLDRLKHQVAILETQADVGVVGCYYENYVEDRNITRVRRKVADNISFNDLSKGNVFSHGEVMFRKETYYAVGGYRAEFINCQDYDLWLRMIKKSKLATAKEVLYTRFIRYDGVSYKPDKFLKQSRYFFLCQDLAHKSILEQKEQLNKITQYGIENYMDLSSKRIQTRIIKAALRSAVWGKYEESIELTKKGVTNKLFCWSLISFVVVYKSFLGMPLRSIVNNKLGIK